MQKLEHMLSGSNNNPFMVVSINTVDLQALQALADEKGYHLAIMDGATISSKDKLFDSFASAFHFPDYFGRNWDALKDCLTDLNFWISKKGYVLFFRNTNIRMNLSESDFRIFRELIVEVAEYWRIEGVVFLLIMEGEEGKPE